jgi:hypothetical protein
MLGNIPNTKLKPLVILGAGASYDLINTNDDVYARFEQSDFRPPLTDEIFKRESFTQISSQLPQLNGLIGCIRTKMNSSDMSLESVLSFMEEDPKQLDKFKSELFYLKKYLAKLFFKISKENESYVANNYSTFFRQLRLMEDEFCVVNFNYDFLAQKALQEEFDIPYNKIQDYINKKVKLIHVHGSVLWEEGLDNNLSVREPGDFVRSFNKIRLTHPTGVKGFSCPEEHHNALVDYITKCNVIISIGWRGAEDHFNKLFTEINGVPKRIIVVGKSDNINKEFLKRTNLSKFRGGEKYYISGFSNCLNSYPDFDVMPKVEHII